MSRYYASVKRESPVLGRPASISLDQIKVMRAAKLVPWAKGKCERCGSTLCEDPFPHDCRPRPTKSVDYDKCVPL